jgi:voltage-gated potassium channel
MTTVGYGDHYPVTVEGRLIAGGLLISGIAVISTLTAIVSKWIFAGKEA